VVAHFFYMTGSGTPAIKAGGEQVVSNHAIK
jgi:hypothetical protein